MSIPPKKLREVTFQILYCYDIGYADADDIINMLMHELSISKKNMEIQIR